jgi:thymidylate synthase ThyX
MSKNQIEVTLIDSMGSDLSIVNAARVSFGKGSEWDHLILSHQELEESGADYNDWEMVESFYEPYAGHELRKLKDKDAKLLKYLAKHKHISPFGHVFLSFHVKAPIFVARQLVKHKFLRWNEISRRYVDDEPEFYTPDVWRSVAENVKQGSSTTPKPHPEFVQGFCIQCGIQISQASREQGGGRTKKYCSGTCKSNFTNRHRDPYKSAFQNAKARVLREGKRVWLLEHDAMEYPQYCPYLGLQIDYSLGDKGSPQDNSPSFDRIDSNGDYAHGNVQVISNLANSMKNSADKAQQVAFAKKVLLMHEGYVVDDTKTYKGQMQNIVEVYNALITDGYPAEQARMVLPQSTMTEWYWSGSLDAFTDMCKLRLGSDTQLETQYVAQGVYDKLKERFPVSAPLLVEGVI